MKRRQALRKTAILMGAAVSIPAVTGILKGCKPSGRPDWEPRYFTKEQATLVGEIAGRIIPTTDTPGAKDVQVDEFIDVMLADSYPAEKQRIFLNGLNELEAESKAQFDQTFTKCDDEQKDSLLKQSLQKGKTLLKNDPRVEHSFFHMIKELTLLGYFTSEPGMKQALNYVPIPGNFKGCIPLEKTAKSNVGNHVA